VIIELETEGITSSLSVDLDLGGRDIEVLSCVGDDDQCTTIRVTRCFGFGFFEGPV